MREHILNQINSERREQINCSLPQKACYELHYATWFPPRKVEKAGDSFKLFYMKMRLR